MQGRSYKSTEKWWLGLVILFYALYNFPGYPAYGDANAAILHGALTLIPLWIISYAGMIILFRQRRLKARPAMDENAVDKKEGVKC